MLMCWIRNIGNIKTNTNTYIDNTYSCTHIETLKTHIQSHKQTFGYDDIIFGGF